MRIRDDRKRYGERAVRGGRAVKFGLYTHSIKIAVQKLAI
jgi:hypothetical protein